MAICFRVLLAVSFAVLAAGGAAAKTTHPVRHHRVAHHRAADVRYAQGFYDYRAASAVREEFRDASRGRWRDDRTYGRTERRGGMVVENLRSGDFTGGVGYGLNGDVPSFTDGFGQTHFFVGSFRAMGPRAHFGAPRPGFGHGFR